METKTIPIVAASATKDQCCGKCQDCSKPKPHNPQPTPVWKRAKPDDTEGGEL